MCGLQRDLVLRNGGRAILQTASEEDAPGIHALRVSVASESAWTIDAVTEVMSAARIASMIQKRRPSASLWLVALRGAQVAGEAMLRVETRTRLNHVGHFTLMVKASERGNGLGTALLSRTIEYAKEHPQIHKISLAVLADHAHAVSLYRRAGFREEGRRARQVQLTPQQFADDIIMGLWVKSDVPP